MCINYEVAVSSEEEEFWSSYEAFADEYCDFAENYDLHDTATLDKALDYLDTAMDYASKAAAYDEKKMSDTDAKYFASVRKTVETKMDKINANL